MSDSLRRPSTLPWHKRLEARVLLGVTLVVGVSLLAMLLATRGVVTRHSLERSGDDLLTAREAFNHLVDSRAKVGAKQARLITELPIFRSLLGDSRLRSDPPTVNRMAEDYCHKLEADFCLVGDADGRSIGQANYDEDQRVPALRAVVEDARRGQPGHAFVTLSKGLFLIVAEPAYFGPQEILGTFVAGYRLDDAVARELALVTHCDVSFVCANGEVCGTSLPLSSQLALKTLLARENAPLELVDTTPALRQLGGAPFVGGIYPLSFADGDRSGVRTGRSDGAARLVLLQDWTPTERAIGAIYRVLLWVGFGTFGIALGGGYVFSRQMTRPLRDLAAAADEIAAGSWAGRAPVAGPAEARTMAEAFNRMTITLGHWHREATSQAAQVQEAYERFRAVTNSTHDAIVSVNRRGEIVFWNSRAHAVFGYDEQDALGQPLTLILPERYRHDYVDQMARVVLSQSRWLGSSVELAGMRRDGSEVPIEVSLSTWKAGQELFYTAVIRDITERRQAAEALNQRESQLRQAQKMEAVGRLAGGIAHDFNNLLTAILGYADLLLEDLPEGQPLRKDAEEIQKAGRSATSLVRDLLAFSRKQVLQPVVLDMNTVVSGTENLLRRLIGEHIELVLSLQTSAAQVVADRGQLEQVLINLAVNARDAMPSGGRLTIRTSVTDMAGIVMEQGVPPLPGRHAVLTVSDSGLGMSPETRTRIFEPFFTTKAVGKGTGLGLATVYGIVKQSGGQIWVDSEIGKGATFNVAFPMIDAPVLEAATDDCAQSSAKGSELVLLVEDNDSVRSLARDALVRNGYRVIEARNGEEGLRLGASHLLELSLLLTDVVMPIMGGRELADQLSMWRPGLKIIFTSGYIDDAVTRQATSSAGATFLQKPFTPAVLGRVVRDVLDASQAVSSLS